MTVNCTPYEPAAAYACVGLTPVPAVPSPNVHAYDEIVCPVPPVDVDALKNTDAATPGLWGENVNAAVGVVGEPPPGSSAAPAVTGNVLDAESPRSLVTVTVTLYVAAAENVCVTALPVPDVPSPKVHAYDVIEFAPVPAWLVEASNVTGVPATTGVGDIVNAAVGLPAGARMMPGGTRRMSTV